MSIKLMTEVWACDLPPTEKLVLMALADRANDEGVQCHPGIQELKRKSGASERTVQGCIKRLVEMGHLTRHERPGHGVNYIVHPRRNCTPAETAPPQKTSKTPAESAGNTPRTIIKVQRATPSSPARERAKRTEITLPDWLPRDAWTGFVEMRRKIGKPMTDRASALAIERLQELAASGHPPGRVLDQSTMNNWQGLFEIKGDDHGNRASNHQARQPGSRADRARPAPGELNPNVAAGLALIAQYSGMAGQGARNDFDSDAGGH